jgi:hypothetical protein
MGVLAYVVTAEDKPEGSNKMEGLIIMFGIVIAAGIIAAVVFALQDRK